MREPLPLWMNDAECQQHQDLPWTDDLAPDFDRERTMNLVCSSCPVIIQCGRHALEDAQGGFFAGVWIPWAGSDGRNDSVRARGRARARARLRSKVKCYAKA